MTPTDPIPVKDALRLCEMGIEDCDKASAAPWRQRAAPEADCVEGLDEEPICSTFRPSNLWGKAMANAAFTVLARATMREMLLHLKAQVDDGYYPREEVRWSHGEIYPSTAALRDHYDKTRPGWRQE